jgi:hypothetical protein
MVDVLISAAPVLFGESTGQGASTRKPSITPIGYQVEKTTKASKGWPSGVGKGSTAHSHQPATTSRCHSAVGHRAGSAIESGLVVAQAALGSGAAVRQHPSGHTSAGMVDKAAAAG